MERGKQIEGESEKGKATKLSKRETLFNYCGGFLEAAFKKILELCSTTQGSSATHPSETSEPSWGVVSLGDPVETQVSFSAFRKDIVNVLVFLERLKNEENQKNIMVVRIEKLKLVLAFFCTYTQLSYSDLEEFEDIMTGKRKEVADLVQSIVNHVGRNMRFKYEMRHVLPRLRYNIRTNSRCRRSRSSATMTEEQLDFLLLNLHHLSKYHAKQVFPLVNEYEILQGVCGNIRDFHALKVNGCVEHEIIEYVLPQLQLMAERIGLFLWDSRIHGDSRLLELSHLILKIVPIELQVMHICYTNLRASASREVGCFIKQLLETQPDILRGYLIHLQEHMVNVITANTSGARNIHVMIEFLLIVLTNMPKEFIHHDKFFDLLEHVGELIREVSTLVHDSEENSRNEESTDGKTHATSHLMENIEHMKGDLRHVYLKAPDSSQLYFPMSDGSLFMHLLLMHLNDLLNSNAYSVALIKEEIKLVKEDLEFIRSFLINVEKELYKDIWARILDLAYEAKDVIDSIIVRDNGLLHLIFSLPFVVKKIKLTKEEVPNLLEKIPKNKGIIVVKSPTKYVKRKSLTTGQTIVGFKEETDLIISKLTSGPKMLDVISITGTPGSGKTTLAYKVYNDMSVPLTSDSLSTIARLPKLEILNLEDAIIEGGEWNLGEEDTFQNLKCLTLLRVTPAKLEAREESFPVLEKLELWECFKLEEIPPSFGDICSLKSIVLRRSPQLEASALEIKKYVEGLGGDIQVLVYN